jgi:hypothetical protein
MSVQLPPLEARVSAQERRHLILDARVEELSQNIVTQRASYQNLEARVSAEEHMQTTLHVRVEELSRDMTASFRQLADYQIQTERKIEARFDKIETDIATIKEDMVAMESRIGADIAIIKEDISTVKKDMVAMESRIKEEMVAMESRMKEEMVAMESRIMDAFKHLVATIDLRLPSPQQ